MCGDSRLSQPAAQCGLTGSQFLGNLVGALASASDQRDGFCFKLRYELSSLRTHLTFLLADYAYAVPQNQGNLISFLP